MVRAPEVLGTVMGCSEGGCGSLIARSGERGVVLLCS